MINWTSVKDLADKKLRKVFREIPVYEITGVTCYPDGKYYISVQLGESYATVSETEISMSAGNFSV